MQVGDFGKKDRRFLAALMLTLLVDVVAQLCQHACCWKGGCRYSPVREVNRGRYR